MMLCPECGSETAVIDTRPTGDAEIRRRRRCECGFRFTTYERIGREPAAIDAETAAEFGKRLQAIADEIKSFGPRPAGVPGASRQGRSSQLTAAGPAIARVRPAF